MIARVWTGIVATGDLDDYVAYVRSTGVAEYARTDGCRLAMTTTRDVGGGRFEVVAFSVWESEAHLQAFAGTDIAAMVLYPEDEQYLVAAPTLVHYDVRSMETPAPLGRTVR